MGKIAKLKDIRDRSRDLDIKDPKFSQQLVSLTRETLENLDEPGDQQEINWAGKSLKILGESEEGSSTISEADKDLAFSYLEEALNAVITRDESLE